MKSDRDNDEFNEKYFYIDLLIILVLVLICLFFGHGINIDAVDNDETVNDLNYSLQKELDLADEDEDADISVNYDLKATSEKLNWAILKNLDDKDNYFYSSYDISKNLAVLAQGANGVTKEELNNVLIKDKETRYTYPDGVYSADSVWLHNSSLSDDLEESFTKPVVEKYNTDVKLVDFEKDTLSVSEAINSYVDSNTEGYITGFNPKVTKNTKINSVSAFYFSEPWYYSFDTINSAKFKGANKTTRISMMQSCGKSYNYIEKKNLRGILIPYQNNLRMEIILPSKNCEEDIVSLLKRKNENFLKEFIDELEGSNKLKI